MQCIEEIVARFSEPEQEHILQLVRSHLGDEASATAAAKEAEAERVAAAAAAMDVDGPEEVDEREAQAMQEEEDLIDDVQTWTRAGDDAENDIDEVAD